MIRIGNPICTVLATLFKGSLSNEKVMFFPILLLQVPSFFVIVAHYLFVQIYMPILKSNIFVNVAFLHLAFFFSFFF